MGDFSSTTNQGVANAALNVATVNGLSAANVSEQADFIRRQLPEPKELDPKSLRSQKDITMRMIIDNLTAQGKTLDQIAEIVLVPP